MEVFYLYKISDLIIQFKKKKKKNQITETYSYLNECKNYVFL